MNKQSIQTNSEVEQLLTCDGIGRDRKAEVLKSLLLEARTKDWMRIADLENEVKRLQDYEGLYSKAVGACLWMQEDNTLGLLMGDTLTTDGVAALRKQRDELRAANMWWVDEEMSTECIEEDLDQQSFDPGDHIVEVTCARSLPNEFYIWHVADWNDELDTSENELTGPFKTRAEAESAK